MKALLPLTVIFVILATFLVLLKAPPATTNFSQTPPSFPAATLSATSSNVFVESTSTPTIPTLAPKTATTSKKLAYKPKIDTSLPKSTPTQTQEESPYTFQPKPLASYDSAVRSALVNILCMPQGGTLRPISGSGVIIDPRGVILTNAHVAQFVLVSESPQINLECTIRSGSPALPRWKARVLYIPPVWVNSHYTDVNSDRVVGTGEHDYALLLITSDVQDKALNAQLPYLPVDTRENVTSEGDSVLGAGYPAEFVGGIVAQQGLYAATSVSTIKQLLTFNTSTVDVFSIGGVIEAQGGSSGGPVVNAWGYVTGIISTTSEGATTAQRDLHALSLNYINKDIFAQTGRSFASIVNGDLQQQLDNFSRETAPDLIQKYIDYLSH